MNKPYILNETNEFAVVFKPPKTHCAENKSTQAIEQNTLLGWYSAHSPPVFDIMHRLDYETHGLVLFAKNEKSFNFFKSLQDTGDFIKEYSAVCFSSGSDSLPEGFPPAPNLCMAKPVYIESYFRPFGPGRKQVRPVIEDGKKHKEVAKDKNGFYRTEIVNIEDNVFTVQIKRGFRHQIRCHLCWIGYPIINDPLYSHTEGIEETASDLKLALRAHALYFLDPSTGLRLEYHIEKIRL
jgi:23S rRNA pseudouridine1911/1915/1917 synthase